VTFQEARTIVANHVAPLWRNTPGTMYVAPWGLEDDEYWWIVVGAEEHLVYDDDHYMLLDGPSWMVAKADGQVVQTTVLEQWDRTDRMTPVGEGRPFQAPDDDPPVMLGGRFTDMVLDPRPPATTSPLGDGLGTHSPRNLSEGDGKVAT